MGKNAVPRPRKRTRKLSDMAVLIPNLTPHGHLVLAPAADARALTDDLQRRVEQAFERGAGQGLLDLGLREIGTALLPVFAFWRDFAARYVTTLCVSAEAPDSE